VSTTGLLLFGACEAAADADAADVGEKFCSDRDLRGV